MSARTLVAQLAPFVGREMIGCIDEIKVIAAEARYSVNVMDPDYNVSSINEDYSRLNVRTDASYRITSFTIG